MNEFDGKSNITFKERKKENQELLNYPNTIIPKLSELYQHTTAELHSIIKELKLNDNDATTLDNIIRSEQNDRINILRELLEQVKIINRFNKVIFELTGENLTNSDLKPEIIIDDNFCEKVIDPREGISQRKVVDYQFIGGNFFDLHTERKKEYNYILKKLLNNPQNELFVNKLDKIMEVQYKDTHNIIEKIMRMDNHIKDLNDIVIKISGEDLLAKNTRQELADHFK